MKEPLRYTDHRLELWVSDVGKPWPPRLKCRRKYHRAFARWYAENEQRFAVKLRLLKRTDTILHIAFCRVTTILTASVMDYEIDVDAVFDCTHWDQILWLDARTKRVPGGYVCDLCPEDARVTYPTREAIWQTEIFEPFLEWVNDHLMNAVALSVSGTPDRATWARLVRGKVGRQRY